MSKSLKLENVSFSYPGSARAVLSDVNLKVHQEWRLAVIGPNGLGKSTLAKIFSGELNPSSGSIQRDFKPVVFRSDWLPGQMMNCEEVILQHSGELGELRKILNEYEAGTRQDWDSYYGFQERFSDLGGYAMEQKLHRNLDLLELDESFMKRDFLSLSGGEKTRLLLAAYFLGGYSSVLLDEPTSHLDFKGRKLLSGFLQEMKGLILISHERSVLREVCDHVLELGSQGLKIFHSGFGEYEKAVKREKLHQLRTVNNLNREVKALERSSLEKKAWSCSREAEKRGAYDKGFVGARAAKMMKRAITIKKRSEQALEDKKEALQGFEKSRSLKFQSQQGSESHAKPLLEIYGFELGYDDGGPLFKPVDLVIQRGEIIALTGENGVGKTSFLRFLAGEREGMNFRGNVQIPDLKMIRCIQEIRFETSSLEEYLKSREIEPSRFYTIMGCLGVSPKRLSTSLHSLSPGEKRKLELSCSLCAKADLLIWDEPLNFLDMKSRIMLEELLRTQSVSLVLVEHDFEFLKGVGARRLNFKKSVNRSFRGQEEPACEPQRR